MKTKHLAIIFSLFLLITLAGASVIFFTKEKSQPIVSERPAMNVRQTESATSEPTAAATSAKATTNTPEKTKIPPPPFVKGDNNVVAPVEEKIKAVMIIDGAKYEAAVKLDSSAYNLMNNLKQEGKINFNGNNYSSLGFFVEEINGVKNNPAGKNWVYYVNGQPAPVGISNYKLKNNDIIEWKYEKKSF